MHRVSRRRSLQGALHNAPEYSPRQVRQSRLNDIITMTTGKNSRNRSCVRWMFAIMKRLEALIRDDVTRLNPCICGSLDRQAAQAGKWKAQYIQYTSLTCKSLLETTLISFVTMVVR